MLSGIYTALIRANISVEMLSDLIFINKNSTASVRNTPIYVSEISLDALAVIIDEMESNPYVFLDASDPEWI